MADANLKFADIERELAADRDGKRLYALRERLRASGERCRARLDKGVPPDRALRLEALLSAYRAGEALLPQLWKIQQQSM